MSAAFTVDTAAPVISNVTASQDAGANTFVFSYDVSEDAGNVTTFLEISGDGGSTWTVPITSAAGALGVGITAGTGKTITWDGATDYNDQEKINMKIRVTANDQYTNEGDNTSANFSLDTKAPRLTNLSGAQSLATTTVTVTYDLAEQNNSLVILDISSDSGSTWTVATTTLTGHVGSGVIPATGKTISWNPKIDFNNQTAATMRARVRAQDTFSNQSSNVTSANFSLDTLPPVANVATDLQAQPNAGDTTVSIGGSFIEINPNTNNFYVALNGGAYGSATAGQSNTVSPSDQAVAAGATLDGNDYISKVKITHADDYGQIADNENTSLATIYKYVKPYMPAAPTVTNPMVGTVDVTVNKNSSETDGLEYAIFENTQSKYVQANGALGASAVWQALGTGAGQWGNSSGVSGKITVSGLSNPSYTYQFQVKSRNTSDASNAASSASALSSSASSQNQAPTITFNSTAQTTDGSKYVNINYLGIDLESDTSTLVTYKYSTDNTNYFTMTEKSGVGSDGVSGLLFSPSPGVGLDFMWDVNADLPVTENTTAYVRLQANDGTNSGAISTASAFTIDTKNPVISSVSASQTSGTGNVAITYTLTDLSTSNVELNISNDGGSTWMVATSSVSGDVGAGISPGSGRSITWNAGVDFSDQEVSNMKVRLRAVDAYSNLGSFVSSANFVVDTKAPVVSSVVASQLASSSTVNITYTLADTNNSSVYIEISEDNGSTWVVATTTLTGAVGADVTPGSKTVTWNAAIDFASHQQSDMVVRVRAVDVYNNVSGNVDSSAFSVDTSPPGINTVVAAQTLGTQNISITYNLVDANNATVAFDVSDDGGSTWNVTHSSVTGDVGVGIVPSSGKTITWNVGADYPSHQNSNMMVRVRGTDTFNNTSANVNSATFGLDTLAPAINVVADLQSQPNAGDTTVLVGGSFTEANPNINNFFVAINGGVYGPTTTGEGDAASPANQATNVGISLTGNDYISKVKIVHTDDYGQSATNQNTSPNTAYKFVKPYIPDTPTVNNPQNTSIDLLINAHVGESTSVEYAILEVSTNKYVQTNGTLDNSEFLQ
ncbi:MAG: Transcriptional regulator [Candidatus Magasanikbacteria bacterium GW2011_GWA2_37_8]|uniref:Transcriptional regulator n=1 Tax=Candidatus Magasanikbacteria bacterium GW2011_GWA2_37_8 TaxID=1619036 RepID=A0A0G0JVI3_9BACT|nr:MAG: Transcriptional regulator [Candidatus Magasanikbacteria bacterium GW2011_GWA2_37_8]